MISIAIITIYIIVCDCGQIIKNPSDIGPVIDAKTLARQNARIATIKITKTVADLLVKFNTFLKN